MGGPRMVRGLGGILETKRGVDLERLVGILVKKWGVDLWRPTIPQA